MITGVVIVCGYLQDLVYGHKITASDTAGTNLDERSQAEEKKQYNDEQGFSELVPRGS